MDHTNARIQADIIEWMRWLRTDLGFDAFRFDNTKGYAGGFTNYYIQQTDPVYTVSGLASAIPIRDALTFLFLEPSLSCIQESSSKS